MSISKIKGKSSITIGHQHQQQQQQQQQYQQTIKNDNNNKLITTKSYVPHHQKSSPLLKIGSFVPSFVPNTSTTTTATAIKFRRPLNRSYSTLSSSIYYKNNISDHHSNKSHHQRYHHYHHHRRFNTNNSSNCSSSNNNKNGIKNNNKNNNGRHSERNHLLIRQRSKSSLSSSSTSITNTTGSNSTHTTTSTNGMYHINRPSKEQERLPDRINYDRRGLTTIPVFENESNLRLLSLQHNLINVFHIPSSSTLDDSHNTCTKQIDDIEGKDILKPLQNLQNIDNNNNNNDSNNKIKIMKSSTSSLSLQNILSCKRGLTTTTVPIINSSPAATLSTAIIKKSITSAAAASSLHTTAQLPSTGTNNNNNNNKNNNNSNNSISATFIDNNNSNQLKNNYSNISSNNGNSKNNNVIEKATILHSVNRKYPFRKSKSFIHDYTKHINNLKLNLKRSSLLRTKNLLSFEEINSNNNNYQLIPSSSSSSSENFINGSNNNISSDNNNNRNNDNKNINELLHIKNNQLNPYYGNVFQNLVFLDLYNNQIEKISNLDGLTSLTVLLIGKNRITDISGLASVKNTLRVLDLHGNKLINLYNNINCLIQLKSLNLAGNQLKQINSNDFSNLINLKELNLKRNKIKSINGFNNLINLERLWLCNNDLNKINDILTISNAYNLLEVTIENNPISLAGDCVSFLVSHLPKLSILSQMPITEQVRNSAMIWRKNKELMNLTNPSATSSLPSSSSTIITSDVKFNNIRREEIISNARTNWELLRSHQQIISLNKMSNCQQQKQKFNNERQQIDNNDNNFNNYVIEQKSNNNQDNNNNNKIQITKFNLVNEKHTKNLSNDVIVPVNDIFHLPPILNKTQNNLNPLPLPTTTSSSSSGDEKNSSGSSLGPNIDSSSSCYSSDLDDKDTNNNHNNNNYNCNNLTTININNNNNNNSINDLRTQISQINEQSQFKCDAGVDTITNDILAKDHNIKEIILIEDTTTNNSDLLTTNNCTVDDNSNKDNSNKNNCSNLVVNENNVLPLKEKDVQEFSKEKTTNNLIEIETITTTSVVTTTETVINTESKEFCNNKTQTNKTSNISINSIKIESETSSMNNNNNNNDNNTATENTCTTKTTTATNNNNVVLNSSSTSSSSSEKSLKINNRIATDSNNNNNKRFMNNNTTNFLRSQTAKPKLSTVNHHTIGTGLNNNSNTSNGGLTTTISSKSNKQVIEREREQGGDYLIEICGRYLNIYGLGALRFIDKQWNTQKANDVHTLNFSYINFNNIALILSRIKLRFPNAEHFIFRETNINSLGQLNALSELQGITTLVIDTEGNPICNKNNWRLYAIYRLSHWGLKTINGIDITENDIDIAQNEYYNLSDLIIWSMPDTMLQPLLTRLRLDETCLASKLTSKEWLMKSDQSLKLVVSKEALQWKKSISSNTTTTPTTLYTVNHHQDEYNLREKGKLHLSIMIENACNSVEKLQKLEILWPNLLLDIVRNTLIDYSQLDVYIKTLLNDILK